VVARREAGLLEEDRVPRIGDRLAADADLDVEISGCDRDPVTLCHGSGNGSGVPGIPAPGSGRSFVMSRRAVTVRQFRTVIEVARSRSRPWRTLLGPMPLGAQM